MQFPLNLSDIFHKVFCPNVNNNYFLFMCCMHSTFDALRHILLSISVNIRQMSIKWILNVICCSYKFKWVLITWCVSSKILDIFKFVVTFWNLQLNTFFLYKTVALEKWILETTFHLKIHFSCATVLWLTYSKFVDCQFSLFINFLKFSIISLVMS